MPDRPKHKPADLVADVAALLTGQLGIVIEIDQDSMRKAWTRACLLLLALDVDPDIDPEDHSPEAEQIRDLLLEERTYIKTKSRRAV